MVQVFFFFLTFSRRILLQSDGFVLHCVGFIYEQPKRGLASFLIIYSLTESFFSLGMLIKQMEPQIWNSGKLMHGSNLLMAGITTVVWLAATFSFK